MSSQNILVTIRCATFNHGQYIRQTLDGFVMQKTNFAFEAIVHDDASTDNTADIIREYAEKYPDIIKPFFEKENQYSKGGKEIDRIFEENSHGKYMVICEGDDFWTDPMKLQKQVDFLEAHPDYNLCCHNWDIIQDGQILPSPIDGKYPKAFSFTFATLPWIWITKTVTTMYRASAVIDNKILHEYKYARDVHLVYYALKSGKGYYMPEVMATYRMHSGGVWSKIDINERNKTTYNLYKELYQHEPNKAVRKRYMNATLAYFNGLAFGKKTWWHIRKNTKLYFEALRNISDAKDIIFCLGGLVHPDLVKWVMHKFRI
ncbi:MAG: glycosyltransferase [Bacteroidales bacterium]|nr:glycosyltransferase [Bacteroidales bacterium]